MSFAPFLVAGDFFEDFQQEINHATEAAIENASANQLTTYTAMPFFVFTEFCSSAWNTRSPNVTCAAVTIANRKIEDSYYVLADALLVSSIILTKDA